jgi:hypothetical protein
MKLVEIIVTASRSDLIQKCDKYVGLGYGLYREDLGAQPQVELSIENSKVQSFWWERLEMLFYSEGYVIGKSIECSEEAQSSLRIILGCSTVSYRLMRLQRRSPLRSTIIQISINCECTE